MTRVPPPEGTQEAKRRRRAAPPPTRSDMGSCLVTYTIYLAIFGVWYAASRNVIALGLLVLGAVVGAMLAFHLLRGLLLLARVHCPGPSRFGSTTPFTRRGSAAPDTSRNWSVGCSPPSGWHRKGPSTKPGPGTCKMVSPKARADHPGSRPGAGRRTTFLSPDTRSLRRCRLDAVSLRSPSACS